MGAAIVALLGISCGPRDYVFDRLEIDSSLHIHPAGKRSVIEPTQGSYYFFSSGGNAISVDHYAKKLGSKSREQLLYLEAYHDSLLERTVKRDEILKGPFGTLYSTKECIYNSPFEGSSVVFDSSYSNDAEHEIPRELAAPPQVLPPLTFLSLSRIFKDKLRFVILPASAYVIVSASYEPDGRLGGLHVNKAQNGDNTNGDNGMGGMGLELTYGIPKRIDLQRYLASRQLELPPSSFVDFADVVVEHYGYNKIIREEKLSHGVALAPRFLQPSVTVEEKILNPVCDAGLAQQAAAFRFTVR